MRLIEAIEDFERAHQQHRARAAADTVARFDQAQNRLFQALNAAVQADHDDVCENLMEGCAEGVSHNGTTYTTAFNPDGLPVVIVMRRVREAAELDGCLIGR